MPEPNNLTPIEWVLTHRSFRDPIAIIRRLRLGPENELYYRAVTCAPESSARNLIGYWATLDDAEAGAIASVEQGFPPAWLGTSGSTARERAVAPPQKALPGE